MAPKRLAGKGGRVLKVWGRTSSVNVQKVLWCCEELGLPYERVDAGGPFGGTDAPEYLSMNPNGLVPTVSDDGFTLWESNTIVRYLVHKYGTGTLVAEEPAGRALAEKWMDFQLETLFPAFRAGFLGLTRTPLEERDPEAIAASLRKTARLLALLDAHLEGEEFVAGEGLGVGDVALGPVVYRWLNIEIDRLDLPNLERWHERLTQRPAYRKTVMVPVTLT
jgi:glutathione S-transferase